eukprot:1159070-Pelagomonas_calceolata.AAC.17
MARLVETFADQSLAFFTNPGGLHAAAVPPLNDAQALCLRNINRSSVQGLQVEPSVKTHDC